MSGDHQGRHHTGNALHRYQKYKGRHQAAAGAVSGRGRRSYAALRGDIPLGETTTCGDFDYATDLVAFTRKEFGDKFEIAVAGSPEGHISCRSLDADIAVLRQKQDNGADYIMTQLCWDMEQFKVWLDKIRSAGVTMPVDVGIMPILDQAATINMALSRNGCVMERELARLISKYWLFPNPFAAKDAEASRSICSMSRR